MTHRFDDAALAGVLGHMNDDHADDNLLIARAFGPDADVIGATMTGFDGDGGDWVAELADGDDGRGARALAGRADHRARARCAARSSRCTTRRAARLGVEPRPHA